MEDAATTQAPPEPVAMPDSPLEGDVWPQVGGADFMVSIGAVYLVFGAGGMLGAFVPATRWPLTGVGIVVGAALLVYGVRFALPRFRLRSRRRLPPGDFQDVRLRAIAPSKKLRSAIDTREDVAFEPVLWRSVGGTRFGLRDPQTGLAQGRKQQPRIAESPDPPYRRLDLSDVGVVLFSVAAVVVFTRVGTGAWRNCLRQEAMWGMMALAVVLSAFVRPVYVRIAPGVMDLFSYPPLGLGRPRCERFDLRRARVVVDEATSWLVVIDSDRAAFPVVFLHLRRMIGPPLAAWALTGARTSVPTPPLPLDELSG